MHSKTSIAKSDLPEDAAGVPGCRHDAIDLALLLYGETDEAESRRIGERMATCPSCAAEYERLSAFLRTTQFEPFVPDPHAAADARATALERMTRRSIRARIFRWNKAVGRLVANAGQAGTVLRWAPRLVTAGVLVVIGFAIGRRQVPVPAVTDTQMELDVRDIEADPVSGEILVRFAVPHAASVRGTLADASVTRSLVYALSEADDSRIRLHALRALNQAPGMASLPDPDLVAAVVALLQTGTPDPLRLRAVEALGSLYSDRELSEEVRSVLLDVLRSDAGDGVRIAALDVLVSRPPLRSDLDRLIEVARDDGNSYVRLMARDAIRQLGGVVPLESAPR